MDELKFNKLAAGFLLAVLLAMGGYKLSEIMIPHYEIAQNAYPIEVTEVASVSSVAIAPAGPEPILAMLSEADIIAGQKIAKKCTACHVFDKGGSNKVGPVLWDVVNAKMGEVDGFAYSAVLSGFGGAWDYQSLNQFLYKPKAYMKGTKMNFAGLKKPSDRANIIAYLRSLSDAPADLPTAEQIAAVSGQ